TSVRLRSASVLPRCDVPAQDGEEWEAAVLEPRQWMGACRAGTRADGNAEERSGASRIRGHVLERGLVSCSRRIVLRHYRQHACQPGKHPSIAAAPEQRLPILLRLVQERRIAEEQMLIVVVQMSL